MSAVSTKAASRHFPAAPHLKLDTDIKQRIDAVRGIFKRNPGKRPVTEELIQAPK